MFFPFQQNTAITVSPEKMFRLCTLSCCVVVFAEYTAVCMAASVTSLNTGQLNINYLPC